MKKRKLLTKIAACATALVLGLSGMGASYAATQPDNSVPHNVYPKPSVYSESGPLFTATNFHIFAEDAASITSHCNGNIATKFLKQGSNSGSNKLYDSQRPEYNYIRKFQDGSVVRFGPETKVVFGKETDVYLRQGAEIYIDMRFIHTYISSCPVSCHQRKKQGYCFSSEAVCHKLINFINEEYFVFLHC